MRKICHQCHLSQEVHWEIQILYSGSKTAYTRSVQTNDAESHHAPPSSMSPYLRLLISIYLATFLTLHGQAFLEKRISLLLRSAVLDSSKMNALHVTTTSTDNNSNNGHLLYVFDHSSVCQLGDRPVCKSECHIFSIDHPCASRQFLLQRWKDHAYLLSRKIPYTSSMG